MLDAQIVFQDQSESNLGLVLFLIEAVPNKSVRSQIDRNARRAPHTLTIRHSRMKKNKKIVWCRHNLRLKWIYI